MGMTSFRKNAYANCTPPHSRLCLFPRSGVWDHAFLDDFPRFFKFICVCAHAGTPKNAWRSQGPCWSNPNPQAWCPVPLVTKPRLQTLPWSWKQLHSTKAKFLLEKSACQCSLSPLQWPSSVMLTIWSLLPSVFRKHRWSFWSDFGDHLSIMLSSSCEMQRVTLWEVLSLEKRFAFCFGARQNWSCRWSWLTF